MGKKRKESSSPIPDNAFMKRTWMEDLALVVDGKKLYVSRTVLALASPVFSAMFQSAFAERDQNEIELTGKSYEDIVEFLLCIYPNTRRLVTSVNVTKILPLAEEYQISTLKADCEKCMLQMLTDTSFTKSTSNVLKYLQLASMYNLSNSEGQCLEVLCDKTQREIEVGERTFPLQLETKNKILAKRIMKMEEKMKKQANDMVKLEQKYKDVGQYYENELKRREEFYEKEGDDKIQGTIKFSLLVLGMDDNANKSSSPVKIRGVDWKVTVNKNRDAQSNRCYLGVWVVFEAHRPHLTCLADVTITLVDKEREKNNEVRCIKDKVFSSANPVVYCAKIMDWAELIASYNNYVVNGEANIEVFIMAHKVRES